MLRRIFGSKKDKVPGEWKRIHNVELKDLYSSPNTILVIKSRMRCAGRVARMGERRGVYRVLVGKPKEGNNLEDPGADRRQVREENPILYSHKTQLNIKLSLLQQHVSA